MQTECVCVCVTKVCIHMAELGAHYIAGPHFTKAWEARVVVVVGVRSVCTLSLVKFIQPFVPPFSVML